MLFFLILSFLVVLTSGQIGTPRKTFTLSSNRGRVFQEKGVRDYSTMLLREDMGVLILGAREVIFALDLSDITNKKSMVEWKVTSSMQETCTSKGKKSTECQNYIRIIHKMTDGRMFVCGTNAFNPTCDYMSYTNGSLTLEGKQVESKGKCPFNPSQRYASVLVDESLYSATSMNFLGSDPAMMRSGNETLRTDHSWLNDPTFIDMKHVPEGHQNPEGDDDKIYLFFNEKAVEYDFYDKLDVSRVARVCKGDLGGQRTLQKKWTSFLKARLDCPVLQTALPYLIQDVFLFCPGNWETCMFYGVFTSQKDMLQYSAVCTYKISDIKNEFSKGKFKTLYNENSITKWVPYNGEVPDPRPGACINDDIRQKGYERSLDLPDKTLQFIRDRPLMDQPVKSSSQQPLLVMKDSVFRCIVVVSTTALNNISHQVMFIGTASGSVLKAVNYDGTMVIIEEVQIFKHSEPVKILQLSTSMGQLYAGSETAVVQMPLSSCGHYTSCLDCVLARDPYCGWSLTSNSCVDISNISPDTYSEMIQSLGDGNAERCPAVESTKTITIFNPGTPVVLECQPASNLARVQWYVNSKLVKSSDKYDIKHNSLVILNFLPSDTERYTCISVESFKGQDYVTQNVTYELVSSGSLSAQSQIQQIMLMILIILLSLILSGLVIWNLYKGHCPVPRCFPKAGERQERASTSQEPLQTQGKNKVASTGFNSNSNNKHASTSQEPLQTQGKNKVASTGFKSKSKNKHNRTTGNQHKGDEMV